MKKMLFILFNPYLVLTSALIFLAIATLMRMQVNELVPKKVYSLPFSINVSMQSNKSVLKKNTISKQTFYLPQYRYVIQFGDNLDNIFRTLYISYQDKKKILAADKKKGRLKKLKVGDELSFWLDKNNRLTKLEIQFHPTLKIVFAKQSNQRFSFREVKAKSKWRQDIISGEILGSFSLSAAKAGLTFKEIDEIRKIFRTRIHLTRELRAGDNFSIIRSMQIVNGKSTGKSEIEAVKIQSGGKTYSAYLHIDGNYYDEEGKPTTRTFLRYPTKKKYKVSSHFNLDRRHPISKKSMPHKGTDFYANTGTKVLATAEGIVKVARYHAKAGYFLVIDHGDQFLTRYLHNSKLLVKKGQKVKRGQLIALSGKSGKVTGAHIHYELWAKGKPVNSVKAIIPSHEAVPNFQHSLYLQLVKKYDQIMKLAKSSGKFEGNLGHRHQANVLVLREK